MQLRSEIQLTSMLKAMKDVVIPAIDPANRLAIEQSQLIVGMLGLMQHQLPIQFKFDRDELGRLVDMLHGLKVICDLDPALEPLPGKYKGLTTESRFALGRVEKWRGGGRRGLSVSGPFGRRCPSSSAMTPFPLPARRTGR
ncbi:MAG: hypothetical protein ACT4QA_24340, partial [Panacagrimonas sp.]